MLPDVERFRLLNGPYRPPRCKIGGWLECHLRGRVKVVAISDGQIQWPMTRSARGGNRTLIVCGDLVKAVRLESTQAIQYWWGVKKDTVWTWRKALGVKQNNAGTIRLRSKWWTDGGTGEASRPGREASFHSPERAAKIATSKKGKPRPPHVAELLRHGFEGKTHTAEARRQMSEARRGQHQGNGRAFTLEEDAILGTMTDKDAAAKLGRHVMTIVTRRRRLGIPSFRRQARGW